MENIDNMAEDSPLVTKDQATALIEKDDREDAFIKLLFLGFAVPEAGQIAGYSESYSKTTLYSRVKNSPKMHQKLAEFADQFTTTYKQWTKTNLPQMARIEQKILDLVEDDPKQWARFKDLFKQQKQTAGVLAVEGSEQNFIQYINEIKQISIENHNTQGQLFANEFAEISAPAKEQDTKGEPKQCLEEKN